METESLNINSSLIAGCSFRKTSYLSLQRYAMAGNSDINFSRAKEEFYSMILFKISERRVASTLLLKAKQIDSARSGNTVTPVYREGGADLTVLQIFMILNLGSIPPSESSVCRTTNVERTSYLKTAGNGTAGLVYFLNNQN